MPRSAGRRRPQIGRVEVDDVEALREAQRARPRRDGPGALALPEAADVEVHPGEAGVGERALSPGDETVGSQPWSRSRRRASRRRSSGSPGTSTALTASRFTPRGA